MYVMNRWNTQLQNMKCVRCCMKMVNMKITELIWREEYLL